MTPNVFVSSTIADLHHLRDAIRDVLIDLGLQPIMSEHSEVGYLPTSSAEDSCYVTMQQCQLAVVIIGRRYGTGGANGVSVTHNEFRTARQQGIPVFCLVEREVLTYRQVYDSNSGTAALTFPGMDAATDTFAFIKEVVDAPTNNAILDFSSAADARHHVKKQLAHLFWELLARRGDSIKAEVRDVLAEVKALRHSLSPSTEETRAFVRAARFLLNDKAQSYRLLLEQLCGTIEDAVPYVIKGDTFRTVVQEATGRDIELVTPGPDMQSAKQYLAERNYLFSHVSTRVTAEGQSATSFIGITRDRHVEADNAGVTEFDEYQAMLRQALKEPTPVYHTQAIRRA
jgi:hypothetical protein